MTATHSTPVSTAGWIALLFAGCAAGDAEHVVVPEEAACPACTIEVREVATLGELDGPGSLETEVGSIDTDAQGRYVLAAGGLPQLFSGSGEYVRTIGRPGTGPGELDRYLVTVPVPGDSVLVIANQRRLASVFTAEGVFGRSIRLPGNFITAVVVRWPDSVLVAGALAERGRITGPLHVVSMSGNAARMVRSGELDADFETFTTEWSGMAASAGPPWWTMSWPYRLIEFDGALVQVRVLERQPPWWQGDRAMLIGRPHRIPPANRVEAVSVDRAGLLWVFVRTPGRNWQKGWGDVQPHEVEVSPSRIDGDQLLDTVVEVIDPAQGRVLARTAIEDNITRALPGGRAVAMIDTIGGYPRARVLAFTLKR